MSMESICLCREKGREMEEFTVRRKIMAVDDEQIVLRTLSGVLKAEYEVITALSGEEALRLARTEAPDLVLMDIYLDKMSGLEIMNEIHEIHGMEQTPVIMMTGSEASENEINSLEQGAVDYLRKPVMPDVLKGHLSKALCDLDARRKLEMEAGTDVLTGVMNRRSAQEKIGEMLAGGCTGAFLMLDMDHFKKINDTYGHRMGDRVLQKFASVLKTFSRDEDVIGRYGGDEFVLFYRNYMDSQSLAKRCSEIVARTESQIASMLNDMGDTLFSVSIGVALAGEDGIDFQTLTVNSDKALYEVKQSGGHGFYFFQGDFGSTRNADSCRKCIDLPRLKQLVREEERASGAYRVDSDDFRKIYRFLLRNAERSGTNVQVVLVTMQQDNEDHPNPEAAKRKLSDVISATLRRGDVAAQYGEDQFMILLMDTTTNNGKIAVDRVMKNWSKSGTPGRLNYEIQGLTA